jgi:site-specific recombinase XerC
VETLVMDVETLQWRLEITDVQWILGHASLTTTQVYLNSQKLHQTGEKLQVAC